jgi:DNA polymerase-3 subunit alpha
VCTSKESTLLLTQYDGKVIEDAGVIKMDFLGLKTLTIIRDALRMIEENHGVEIDIDGIPLDDPKTSPSTSAPRPTAPSSSKARACRSTCAN